MRILYYLEPYAELGKPLFRLATVRNHLDRETQRLLENRALAPQIGMLCSQSVAVAVRRERLLANVQLFTLTQAELRRVYPDYLTASARWYNRDFEAAELGRMAELCRKSLGGFTPDVIVCYESSAPFLEHLFPQALFLHNTLGIFSRAPYPETSALDPFGIGKDAFLRRFAGRIRATQLNDAERGRLTRLKEKYQLTQLERSPLQASHLRGKFERVVLLPLQVSQYFMFDENCPAPLRGKSQLDFVRYVLERVDPSIGVYVTMHGQEATLFTDEVLAELRQRFPHFLFSEDVQRIRWVSQHVLPHVDAVVSVSSSIGLQAMIWNLPVIALGRSHLTGIASSESLTDLSTLLHQGRTTQMDGALYYLLMHYYPPMDAYHHRGEWFGNFLERGIREKQRGFDFDFFAPIDDPDAVTDALIDGLRPGLYRQELSASLRKGGPFSQLPKDEVTDAIAQADLVSFDVFDTLVTRSLSHPRAAFDLMAPQASLLFSEKGIDLEPHGGFRRLREEAGRAASRRAKANGSEEYDLPSVYEVLCEGVGAPLELVPHLKAVEEGIELAIHRPRESGRRAFQQAIDSGKRTILISDIFLDASVVAKIVERCGYQGHAALYVSSEYKLLKRTGRLYEHIRRVEGAPAHWVHLGDNRLSDIQIPSRLGLRTLHLPNVTELYADTPHIRDIWKEEDFDKSIGSALLHGVVSRRFYDRDEHEPRFEGSAYRLGYEAGGPLMLGFVSFVLERAQRDRLTDVYFLSRDGYLPKQVYDLLVTGLVDAPRAHYLYASRRAYSVASLESTLDIIRSLDAKQSTMRLADVLRSRFGVDPSAVLDGTLENSGFGSVEDAVALGEPKQRKSLEAFLTLNADVILAHAKEERSALLEYLRVEGLLDPSRRVAIVDIGHHASLQVALRQLTGRGDIKGYYFSTFYPAHKAYRSGLDISSYLLEFEDSTSGHLYCKNIGMFEFLFLPALPSLMRMERAEDGTLKPVFVPGDEAKRFSVIEEVHRGVIDFCRDVVAASAGQPWLFEVSKNDAIRTYARFLAKPSRIDAQLLDGVSFVDAFGGAPTRYLIASPFLEGVGTANVAGYLKESWWKAGAEALLDEAPEADHSASATSKAAKGSAFAQKAAEGKASTPNKPKNGQTAAVPKETKEAPWGRKLRKLLRDPQGFALDTKVVKSVRKLLRPPSGARKQ